MRHLKFALSALALLLGAASLSAQLNRGTITGTVQDSTGAVIPGVKITIRHADTGAQYETETTISGQFTMPNLPAGEYEITFQADAFKRVVRSGIVLSATDVVRADATLPPPREVHLRRRHPRAAALVIDGGNSMGQIAAAFAMKQAIDRARQSGVAVAVVRGSNHCGALAYFAMMALEHGMIGLATTNALPTMAPWGGADKIVGINPLAVAIPAGNEEPIIIDAAFSASSHGKIRIYHQKGLYLPEGWALDPDGTPTTDPAVAIQGLLRPIGDYKGVGLAIVMGVLSTALSGANYGTDLGSMVDGPKPGHDGQFLLALDVAAFTDPSEFGRRVDRVVRQIRSSRLAPGFDKLYSPGELEASTERRYRAAGIPLNNATVDDLNDCVQSLGLEISLQSLHESETPL